MITLKTLSEATAQEVFDQVATHMLKQNAKSIHVKFNVSETDLASLCAYRGASGMKCAAGCLISDDEYCPSMEGKSWYDNVYETPLYDAHAELIGDLQHVHDSTWVPDWPDELKQVARKHCLQFEALS